jgi:hypothetical protein
MYYLQDDRFQGDYTRTRYNPCNQGVLFARLWITMRLYRHALQTRASGGGGFKGTHLKR